MSTQEFNYKATPRTDSSGNFGTAKLQSWRAPRQPQLFKTILLLILGSFALGSLPIAYAALSSHEQAQQPVPHEASLWSEFGAKE